jgi:hypothetical protein
MPCDKPICWWLFVVLHERWINIEKIKEIERNRPFCIILSLWSFF